MDIVCDNTINCQQGSLRSVRFNVNGCYCVTCGADKKLKLWNPYKGTLLKTYGGHADEVYDAACSCDSNNIVSCSKDKSIILWDVSTGQSLRRLRRHASGVTCVKFNEDSAVAVSGGRDNLVCCWDMRSRNNEPIQILKDCHDCVTSLYVSNYEIVVGSMDCNVRIYDLRTGKATTDFLGDAVFCVSLTKDGTCFLAGCSDDKIRLMYKSTGELMSEYIGHCGDNYNIESIINSNETVIVSGSSTGEIYFWDLIKGEVLLKLVHTKGKVIPSLTTHPEKDILISACQSDIKLWSYCIH